MKRFFTVILTCTLVLGISQKNDTVVIQMPNGQLEGTLSIADTLSKTPVVYIIAGSGPNDRDGNQPHSKSNAHLMLSNVLLAEGISTLRVDKRMSGNSIFNIGSEEEMSFDYFVDDAVRWIDYLDSINLFSQIILLGHSQGSLVAMLASYDNDKIDGLISVAGSSDKVLEKIQEQIYTQTPAIRIGLEPIFEKLQNGQRVDSIPILFQSILRPSVQPFLISWDKYDPVVEIGKLKIPIAIIQGRSDIQVSVADAERLYQAYPSANLTIIENMNHIFKKSTLDRGENIKTYNDPDLPLVADLPDTIVDFVKSVKN